MSLSSSSLPKKSLRDEDNSQDEPSSMKLFGFSVQRRYDQCNKVNARTVMIKNNNKIVMIMKPSSSLRCEYCGQKFATSQALGGHQNAHKAERRLVKLNQLQYQNYMVTTRNITHNTSDSVMRSPPSVAGSRPEPCDCCDPTIGNYGYRNYGEASEDGVLDLELRLAPATSHI